MNWSTVANIAAGIVIGIFALGIVAKLAGAL